MSKKQRKAYLAIAAKYSYKKYLKLNFTFTNNNIFVNLCNGLGESLFKKTFGLIGYNGLKRKSRYALYYYGLEEKRKGRIMVKYVDLQSRLCGFESHPFCGIQAFLEK